MLVMDDGNSRLAGTLRVLATQLALQMQELRAAGDYLLIDIHRDGTMQGPNLEALRELTAAVSIPVIASGGVSSTDL